jgi:CATRA-associated small protein
MDRVLPLEGIFSTVPEESPSWLVFAPNEARGKDRAVATTNGNRAGDLAEARRAAADALADVLTWRMDAPRWTRVAAAVGSLDTALGRRDPDAVVAAVIALELAGPVRITRIGAQSPLPAPAPVRERINRLVHVLVETRP